MKGTVYNGVRLMPGSDALALLQDWHAAKGKDRDAKKKALDVHMDTVDRAWRKLEGRP